MFGRTQEKLEITSRRVSGPRIRIFFIISIFFPQFWPTDQTALSGTRRVEFLKTPAYRFRVYGRKYDDVISHTKPAL